MFVRKFQVSAIYCKNSGLLELFLMIHDKKHLNIPTYLISFYFIFISAECQTDQCKNASILINSSINPSVDPCEDFYQYVCGGWIQEKLSINYDYSDKFKEAEGKISKDLKELIQDEFTNPNNDTSTAKSKADIFYHSCVDMCSNMKMEMEYLPEIVKKIGGWHLNGEFNGSIDFNERVHLLQNHFAVDIFFKWGVQERGGRKYLSIVPLQKKVF